MKAIEFENVGKMYRLGRVGTGTLSHDLNRWWQTCILGKEDPYLKIGQTNDRTTKGTNDYIWALKDISFSIEQGDVVGIIGKNGAGKSTLLKLLSNITSPTTGSICYNGRIASLLEVGTGFHPELTARENIYMNGSIMGMTKAEITRKLDEIVDFAGVKRYIDTPVKRFSSGMTVRLGFAVAAFLEPEILVVDEVLAVGDAEFQKKAIGKMKDVSTGEGRTVLFVSHNMGSIKALCNQGVVLKNGRVDFCGEINDAVNHYMQDDTIITDASDLTKFIRTEKCTGKIRITRIDYLDNNNTPINPRCGAFLRIRMTIVAQEPVRGCHFSIGIRDMFGSPLMTFPTNATTDGFDFVSGTHMIGCDIEKFPLTTGIYNLGLWAETKGECADFLDNVIKIEVEDDDFFCKGKTLPSNMLGKVVLYEHKWSANE